MSARARVLVSRFCLMTQCRVRRSRTGLPLQHRETVRDLASGRRAARGQSDDRAELDQMRTHSVPGTHHRQAPSLDFGSAGARPDLGAQQHSWLGGRGTGGLNSMTASGKLQPPPVMSGAGSLATPTSVSGVNTSLSYLERIRSSGGSNSMYTIGNNGDGLDIEETWILLPLQIALASMLLEVMTQEPSSTDATLHLGRGGGASLQPHRACVMTAAGPASGIQLAVLTSRRPAGALYLTAYRNDVSPASSPSILDSLSSASTSHTTSAIDWAAEAPPTPRPAHSALMLCLPPIPPSQNIRVTSAYVR